MNRYRNPALNLFTVISDRLILSWWIVIGLSNNIIDYRGMAVSLNCTCDLLYKNTCWNTLAGLWISKIHCICNPMPLQPSCTFPAVELAFVSLIWPYIAQWPYLSLLLFLPKFDGTLTIHLWSPLQTSSHQIERWVLCCSTLFFVLCDNQRILDKCDLSWLLPPQYCLHL